MLINDWMWPRIVLLGGLKHLFNSRKSPFISVLYLSQPHHEGDHALAALLQHKAALVAQLYHLQGINYLSLCPSDLQVKLHLVLELSAGLKSNVFSSIPFIPQLHGASGQSFLLQLSLDREHQPTNISHITTVHVHGSELLQALQIVGWNSYIIYIHVLQ